jgi:metallo-beta-lactamase class B
MVARTPLPSIRLVMGAWLAAHLALAGADVPAFVADPPKSCGACDAWNAPREPFRVYGNTWYVGVAGLSSVLIVGKDGAILIDGGLTQSAPLIAEHIRTLGFRVENVRLILNSHTHFDHAGGIAALQRASGAQVAASPASRLALESGAPTPDDPQFGFGREAISFPALSKVRSIADGETLHVGELAVTAHFTPGHTSGSTTWTWRSCEAQHCLDIVYADSLNPLSAPGFKFTADAGRTATFAHSIAVVAKLPCGVLLAPHPDFLDLDAKLAKWQESPGVNPFIDSAACHAYAAGAKQRLDLRIAEERRAK